ncbi:MAG: hypothetical protein J7578_13405 [Chitinophagaceae bacterium]|nr:hypothetical protein [Chitinophagaceae bacterium]
MRYHLLLVLCCIISITGTGQNYHAVNGSSYAGSLGTGNNPASIVNTPWPWDITLFGIQAKAVTNILTVRNYSLLTSPAEARYQISNKNEARYANTNYNINLLNARYAFNRNNAVAAGINIRGYTRARSSRFAYVDTLHNLDQFLIQNQENIPLSADVISSHWIEVYGSYARTIWDNDQSRLNAGITVRISRGLAGGYGNLRNGSFELIPGPETKYGVKSLDAFYAYSSNFDKWDNDLSQSTNIRNFITNARAGIAIDLGVEWLLKEGGIRSFNDADDEYWDYTWKIGASVLDIGYNQYKYSSNSRLFSGLKQGVEATDFDQKFGTVNGIRGFNDSAATLFNSVRVPNGLFNVIDPMRAVLNVDRFITQAFYVNAELSLNLSPLAGDQRLYAKELNFITVTPRWETRKFGFYLPAQFNNEKKFWVGAAVKAGPVLLGLHNLGYIFSKKSLQNGGGYLAIVIRPGKKKEVTREKKDRRMQQYQCPVF